ncbi:spore coat associated protein CotJA [Neglectibacter caecimuris]|uniref:spore coat associated protein CotJA n=1 Tax=Neglectibacter caecimuris TaxID=3093658 RepID=UPI002AC9667A|nr:spore coat associated protein CotJA [Neglectibacter sp. M00184]
MSEEMNGMACGLYSDPTPLPPDPVPTMAYVPYQQWSNQLHSAERALEAGTLFPVLDKPFLGGRREPR